MESNHLPIGYRPIARPESFAGMEPGVRIELTISYSQNERIASNAYPAEMELAVRVELTSDPYQRSILAV